MYKYLAAARAVPHRMMKMKRQTNSLLHIPAAVSSLPPSLSVTVVVCKAGAMGSVMTQQVLSLAQVTRYLGDWSAPEASNADK